VQLVKLARALAGGPTSAMSSSRSTRARPGPFFAEPPPLPVPTPGLPADPALVAEPPPPPSRAGSWSLPAAGAQRAPFRYPSRSLAQGLPSYPISDCKHF
jgi:hypothetical protein